MFLMTSGQVPRSKGFIQGFMAVGLQTKFDFESGYNIVHMKL